MALLESHLEQISLSAQSITDLEFPPSKIFTNALLGSHEITTLIRDTEPHERALFSLNPDIHDGNRTEVNRRKTAHMGADTYGGRKSIYGGFEPRKQSAVARVLGHDMLREIQKSNGSASRTQTGRLDVEVLLRGAEKLCDVYPVPGASEKIASLRSRHRQISHSIAHYEEKVLKQQAKLDRINKVSDYGQQDGDMEPSFDQAQEPTYTEADLNAEEQEIRELEQRKKTLEDRVAGMEKDLGGLLR